MPSFFRSPILSLLLTLALLSGCSLFRPAPSPNALLEDDFASLPGWQQDDVREAWPAFLASCDKLKKHPAWKTPCTAAQLVDASDAAAIRTFFEARFIPLRAYNAEAQETGLMTGYYEPLLRGARQRSGAFQTPLLARPDDLLSVEPNNAPPELKGPRARSRRVNGQHLPYLTRAEITASEQFQNKVILWVDDPVDAFFLQVQGSGRVQLADTNETVRLAYADQNGHPYQSIGRYLADRGEIPIEQASAQGIKAWLAANPSRQAELFNANPSYIFFKEEKIADPRIGPKGALGVPLTPARSVAVDPAYIPLGGPVFISTLHPGDNQPLQRLAIAQDTGSAIKGGARIDYFWGFGQEAGEVAGKTKQRAAVWVLRPRPSP